MPRRTIPPRVAPRLGTRAHRFCFFPNPYRDVRFTTCPRCGGKTRQRALPPDIHPECQIDVLATVRFTPVSGWGRAYQYLIGYRG